MSRHLLAHISDSHFDEHADVEDLVGVHRSFVSDAKAAGVDAIVHAGDFFEGISTARDRMMLAEFLGQCSEVAPVMGVKGNHDRALELDLFPLLRSTGERVTIVDRPRLFCAHGFGFVGLPWFDKVPAASAGVEAGRIATQEQARQLLLGLATMSAEARYKGFIPILVAHVMVGGSLVSTGQMILGSTVEVTPAELLSTQVEAACLGHVHKFQEWVGGRVAYSGSPRRSDHGEPEPKGWRLLVFEDGEFAGSTFNPLPARELYHADFDFTGEERERVRNLPAIVDGIASHCRGARVRVRYRMASSDLALMDKDALRRMLLDRGAYDVKIEAQPVAEDRIRAAEVVTASTLADKVRGFMTAKGITTPRWSHIEAKLAEIEAE